jgi:hypothetical protein
MLYHASPISSVMLTTSRRRHPPSASDASVERSQNVSGCASRMSEACAGIGLSGKGGEVESVSSHRLIALEVIAVIHYHVPSLVQHVGAASTWGGVYHTAPDFERDWKA